MGPRVWQSIEFMVWFCDHALAFSKNSFLSFKSGLFHLRKEVDVDQ